MAPRSAAPVRRVVALAVTLAALAVLPLSAFSNATHLFDPTYYFSTAGGPYTANVGALALAGAVVLLAGLAASRSRLRVRPAQLATGLATALAVATPFVVRHLATGITPPGAGVPLTSGSAGKWRSRSSGRHPVRGRAMGAWRPPRSVLRMAAPPLAGVGSRPLPRLSVRSSGRPS